MKLIFWKKKKVITSAPSGVLWPISALRSFKGVQPLAWNKRLGRQNVLGFFTRIWPLSQSSIK